MNESVEKKTEALSDEMLAQVTGGKGICDHRIPTGMIEDPTDMIEDPTDMLEDPTC